MNLEFKLSIPQRLILSFLNSKLAIRLYTWFLWNQISKDEMPSHVGVILDGNRRWALSKGLKPWFGHNEGAQKAEDFLEWCREIGKIKTITLYVFSTENFNRPEVEVNEIMQLIEKYLDTLITDERIHNQKIRVKIIGKINLLPPSLQQRIQDLENCTKHYENYYLNLAIAYGGRAEIVDAVRDIAFAVKNTILTPAEVNEKTIEERLYTGFLPNPHPDLIIRTSGEERLSNFLPWQGAYSELCFLDVYWPSFRKIDLMRAIRVYQQRHRRFGG
ncbi:MAG: polyprenyl diphosphate synthase [Candidatus Bathyarchaeia archaeon]